MSRTDHADWIIEQIVDTQDRRDLAYTVSASFGYVVYASDDTVREVAWRINHAKQARLIEFDDVTVATSRVLRERRRS